MSGVVPKPLVPLSVTLAPSKSDNDKLIAEFLYTKTPRGFGPRGGVFWWGGLCLSHVVDVELAVDKLNVNLA